MKLGEMFRSDVVTVAPADSVAEAAAKMKHQNVGAVVVVEKEKVSGIVTDRDIALALAHGECSTDSPVREIMSTNVLTIWEDEGVFNATQYFLGHQVRRLPIIDHKDRLVGMVTADDMFVLLARELQNVAKALEPSLAAKSF
jgi:CBS domain-containing protein